ncbi:MAG: hypothetical protein M2R45_02841 [Verrucomicrobia subdivision 3 bacterium]|nr:hypothetical protein [Limisphaerales bacterium]MCS1415456.1 hypothetical protein [Limisphaerales bacterium]
MLLERLFGKRASSGAMERCIASARAVSECFGSSGCSVRLYGDGCGLLTKQHTYTHYHDSFGLKGVVCRALRRACGLGEEGEDHVYLYEAFGGWGADGD